MPARRAVLLTAQGSDPRLLPTILLESTLMGTLQVFILNNLKPFRMNKIVKSPHFAQFWCTVNHFRINTCKSVSKQTTLTSFRINTYEKQGEGGGSPQTVNSLLCQKAILNPLSFHLASQQILEVAHLIPEQIQLPPQPLDFCLGAPIHGVVQFAPHTIFAVLPILVHHDKWIRVPRRPSHAHVDGRIDAAQDKKTDNKGPRPAELHHGVRDAFGKRLLCFDHVVRVAHGADSHELLPHETAAPAPST